MTAAYRPPGSRFSSAGFVMLAIGLFFVRVRHVGHKITGLAVQSFAQRLNGAGVNPAGLLAEQLQRVALPITFSAFNL